jgi:SOS-response transcriptional repressor LexA
LPNCEDRETAYSVLEAIRMGAAKVLDMEREDLEILVIGQAGTPHVDALLYDPMPGGSGLLEQVCMRFKEVCEAAIEVVDGCPSACDRACIDCLMVFRNAFSHKHLNRKKATESLKELGTELTTSHEIPAKLPTEAPSGAKMPTNEAEARLRELLIRAGFPEPEWQKTIPLGRPNGSTTPDCFFRLDDPSEPGVCVYVDGLSEHIHGNPLTAARDLDIRAQLESKGYIVFSIAATELWDRLAMSRHFFRLGKELLDRDRARDLRDQPGWFDVGQATAGSATSPSPAIPFKRSDGATETRFKSCVPLVSLKAAAGLFSESQDVAVEAWVEPATSHRLGAGMFVAQVVGKSMEPKIPDGAYCLFRGPVTGSRSGRILLVQHRDIRDLENGGSYTVKRYRSTKRETESGSWVHDEIRLEPLNPAFQPIVLTHVADDEFMVVAELLEALA